MNKIIKIMKKVKIKNILLLIVLLAFNAYAWFLFTTRATMDLSAHVSSWNVEFVPQGGVASSNITVTVDNIYPGMPNYERTVRVNNRGEIAADLSYEVSRLKVLNDNYTAGTSGITSDTLKTRMQSSYPFTITVTTDTQVVAANNRCCRIYYYD